MRKGGKGFLRNGFSYMAGGVKARRGIGMEALLACTVICSYTIFKDVFCSYFVRYILYVICTCVDMREVL